MAVWGWVGRHCFCTSNGEKRSDNDSDLVISIDLRDISCSGYVFIRRLGLGSQEINQMTEKRQQIEAIGRLLLVVACASLYAIGGMGYLPLRRFVAPVLCGAGMFVFSRDWRVFLQVPFLMGSLSLGYGGDTFWVKVAKRACFGAANGIAGSIYDILSRRFLISVIWTVILIIAYVGIGVFNPFPNARIEELVLGVLVFLKPIMSARRRI